MYNMCRNCLNTKQSAFSNIYVFNSRILNMYISLRKCDCVCIVHTQRYNLEGHDITPPLTYSCLYVTLPIRYTHTHLSYY